ncbi:unnamed protein product [Fusarium graminearum]|nr:hypothetical protein FG05_35395 [Fusarium graminearum]CZS76292.1 unnamed protein product [Fusarium graminearum]
MSLQPQPCHAHPHAHPRPHQPTPRHSVSRPMSACLPACVHALYSLRIRGIGNEASNPVLPIISQLAAGRRRRLFHPFIHYSSAEEFRLLTKWSSL